MIFKSTFFLILNIQAINSFIIKTINKSYCHTVKSFVDNDSSLENLRKLANSGLVNKNGAARLFHPAFPQKVFMKYTNIYIYIHIYLIKCFYRY